MKYLPKTTGDTSALLGHNFDSCDRQHYTQYCPITNGGVRARSDTAVHYRTILRVVACQGHKTTSRKGCSLILL